MKRGNLILFTLLAIGLSIPAFATQTVRLATYNIEWLSSQTTQCGLKKVYDVRTQGQRLQHLKQVVELLNADIIGLQEIRDRQALELIFNPTEWTLVIDDDNNECQDLALAVRHPLTVKGAQNGSVNTGDEHYLFEDTDNSYFPRNRDVLCVEIFLPNNEGSLHVMVHHAKSRYGGRFTTDARRLGASRLIAKAIEKDFDDKPFVLLGDFNDSPDDASLNILETGNPNADFEMEEEKGAFLVNLTEPLYAAGFVSHGPDKDDINNGNLTIIDPNSRARNAIHRFEDVNTHDILFDQLLVPHSVFQYYIQGSAKVFDDPVAVKWDNNDWETASDHLPVYADFAFDFPPTEPVEEETAVSNALKIAALLPNPAGEDRGNEIVVLNNTENETIHLTGWKLRDRAGNIFVLGGQASGNSETSIIMESNSMPLNNSGDTIILIAPNGNNKHEVEYKKNQVTPGQYIRFN